jgi:superfamily II DNA or RNA helicase
VRVWDEGVRAALIVMPTGTGKTRVIGTLARRELELGGRTLVIAHREELLDQLARELARAGVISDANAPGVLEKAQYKGSLSSPAIVASVQSLTTRRLERYPRNHFTKVVVDEAHHSESPSYQRPLEYFELAEILGVTATPDRADGKPLGGSFGRVAYTYEIRAAIADGWLVPIRARRITVKGLDLSSVRSHHGDFDRAQLAAILADEQMLHACAKPLIDEAGDRKTIVFAVDVPHAHALAEVINRYRPGRALAVDGSASTEQRKAALSLFRRGEIQFLVNCALYTEGFDEPTIACVAMARPTQSRALYTQMLGRGTRIVGGTYAESIANGKRDVLVLDFVGNSKHPLRGPADALAGALDDAMRAEVERVLSEGETDVEAALALAEERAAASRSRAEVLALVEYRKRDIDPFLGDQMGRANVGGGAWTNEPATEAQRVALENIGLGRPPVSLTKGEASAILDANSKARARGLATIPQQRVLQNALKLDTRGMTAKRATELILRAKEKGWKPYLFSSEPEARRSASHGIHLDPRERRW